MHTTRRVRITVRGRISERLETLFDGLAIVRAGSRTELIGEITDQAQLHGQLARIRDLGLDLESVETFEIGPATDTRLSP